MDRVFEILILLVVGGLMLAKLGLADDALDFVRASSAPEPGSSYMSASSPWSKDYKPTAPPIAPYPNCAAARAAGAAPIRRGEPGFGPHLDRDGDGIGCEPYRGR